MEHLLEICVDSVESAKLAQQGGADRLELCANLIIGGTSPTTAMVKAVMQQVQIPVNVLLRPRFGDFCFTDAEKQVLLEELNQMKALGVNGVVIGALTPQGELDVDFLRQCIKRAEGMWVTLHRAFDVAADPFRALEQAKALGFDSILTSGQQANAVKGADLIAQLVQAAGNEIHVMAGSGVSPDNMPMLAEKGVRHFHFSAKHRVESQMTFRKEGVPMGLAVADEYLRECTDPQKVAEAKAVLKAIEER